jgi:hypothetical protein
MEKAAPSILIAVNFACHAGNVISFFFFFSTNAEGFFYVVLFFLHDTEVWRGKNKPLPQL